MSGVTLISPKPSFDRQPARYQIGLIALASDHTTERDFAAMCPGKEVAIYVNRIANENPATVENLRKMAPRLTEAAELILPGEPLDVVAYSCTSGSVVIGNDAIRNAVQQAKPGVPCVTPTSAALAAFEALSIRSISLLTPYLPEVSTPMGDFFKAHGIEVSSHSCFGMADDRDIARVTPPFVAEIAEQALDPKADALFIACTALRSTESIERIESRISAPVITSNQAMFWNSLRIAGNDAVVPGYGRLLA